MSKRQSSGRAHTRHQGEGQAFDGTLWDLLLFGGGRGAKEAGLGGLMGKLGYRVPEIDSDLYCVMHVPNTDNRGGATFGGVLSISTLFFL